jgi:hypothetical protein
MRPASAAAGRDGISWFCHCTVLIENGAIPFDKVTAHEAAGRGEFRPAGEI